MPTNKLDFFAKLLEAAKNGTTSGHIASQSGTHQELVDNSLSLLTDLDLLTKERNSPVLFVTTEKGIRFLLDYQHLKKQLGSEGRVRENP